ncbi:MAG: enoyl-CoA hydratase [Lautropia sp.]|nr:enoyl-CoA hydratase [Lautropia sp.]
MSEPNSEVSGVVLAETQGRVGLVRFNRPDRRNALNDSVMDALGGALQTFDRNPDIGAIVVTGGPHAFAAGADISAMKEYGFGDAYQRDFITRNWEIICDIRKPVIAAVAGYALGGGCELAMMCDLIIAADNARFAQPEIRLGTMPGAGGTQRLPRAVGKAKAMDWLLTGRMIDAQEAERAGLVSRVVPADEMLSTAMQVAAEIAAMPRMAVLAIKESVQRIYETPLSEGVRFERRLFHALFATEDQKEGMHAFLEKRPPVFKNR